jgi:1-acyl-sn-glycerol-3-phosphate acyltransferase
MQFLGSLIFTAVLFVWTFILALVFALAIPFIPFERRFAIARFWASSLLGLLRWTCRLNYTVEGWENIPPGAHIALWKHASTWETLAMNVVFPRQVWVLKRELLWIPVVGWCIRSLHAIAIDRSARSSAVQQVVEQGQQRLEEGDWIVIFPEGTRMPVGTTKRYGVSGALLASKTGRLIVPVAHNAGYFWPRRGLLKKPGTIRVMIGPAIEAGDRDPRAINEEVQAWIENQVRLLIPDGHESG